MGKGKRIPAVKQPRLPKPDVLLTREEFKIFAFARDKNQCVICHALAVDAHHIQPRKDFANGGYFLSNAASLCSSCHLLAESGEISRTQLYLACGTPLVSADHP